MATIKRRVDGEPLSRRRLAVLAGGSLISLAAIWGSTVTTYAAIGRDNNPSRVLRLQPSNGPALASRANMLMADGAAQTRAGRLQIAALARDAIRAQPLNPAALVALGTAQVQEIGIGKAYPIFRIADRMTRRSAVTQLWLIQYAVDKDDAVGALAHYDAMLRVQPETGSLLYPVLSAALEDQRLWPAFARYFRDPPPWFEAFFRHAVATPGAAMPLARIAAGPGRLPDSYVNRALGTELLGQLVAQNRFAEAAAYFRTMKDATPAALTSTAFAPRDVDTRFIPFAWRTYINGDLSAMFEGDETGKAAVLRISGGSEAAGEAANRTLMLGAGRYALAADARVITAGTKAMAQWTLRCAGTKRTLGEVALAGPGPSARRGVAFDIDKDCPAQELRLLIDAGGAEEGFDLAVDRVAVTRERKAPR